MACPLRSALCFWPDGEGGFRGYGSRAHAIAQRRAQRNPGCNALPRSGTERTRRLQICLPLSKQRCGGCALTSRGFCRCRPCLISICTARHFNWPCGESCSTCLSPRPCLTELWPSAWPTDCNALRWECAPWQAPWGATPFRFLCRVTELWARAVRWGAMPVEWNARWRCWRTRESAPTAATWRAVTGFLAALRSRRRGVPTLGFCYSECALKSRLSFSDLWARTQKIPSRSSDREGIGFSLEGAATLLCRCPCDGIKQRLAPSWLWLLS